MNIELSLAGNALKAESINNVQANKIIEGFFSTISNAHVFPVPVPSIKVDKTIAVSPTTEKPKTIAKPPVTVPKKEQGESRPKVLPIVDSNKSMTQKPFAALSDLLEKPPETIGDHTVKWIGDGIKENEKGEKLYRTHYWCSCGNSGKRYVPTYYKTCKCHQCDNHLVIEEAVPGEELKQDANGAFYIAREVYESEGEL